MNWDQIEIKWAEMTNRVRADAPISLPSAKVVAGSLAEGSDAPGARNGQLDDTVRPVTAR